MRTLSKNEFSIFVADIIKEIKNYNYDVFHDIVMFHKSIKKVDEENSQQSFFWYIRDNGTWLVDVNNIEFNDSVKLNFEHTKVFKLTFFKESFNTDKYAVVTIETIK